MSEPKNRHANYLVGMPEFTPEQNEEVERELKEEEKRTTFCLELWEKLMERAKICHLTKEEKRDVHDCELYFGGREGLIEVRTRLARK